MRKLLIIAAFFFSIVSLAQDGKELSSQLKAASHDTIRCRILSDHISASFDLDEKLKYNRELEKLVAKNLAKGSISEEEERVFISRKVAVLGNYGYYYQNAKFPKIDLAIEYHKKSMLLAEEIGDQESVAAAYTNIGFAYEDIGNLQLAIDYYHKALNIFRSQKDDISTSIVLNNIGYVFQSQKNYDKALKYYFEGLELYKKAMNGKEDQSLAMYYNNIGLLYNKTGKLEQATTYYEKALAIFVRMKHSEGEGMVLNNIGDNYLHQYKNSKENHPELLDKALADLEKAVAIFNEIEDWESKSITLKNIGTAYLNKGQVDKAIAYGQESYEIAKKVGFPKSIKTSSLLLYDAYERKGDYKNAFLFYKLFHKMDDSIASEQNKKQLIEKDFAYQYDKKEAILKEKARSESKRQSIILIAVSSILGLILLFFFIWLHYYKKKKTAEKLLREKQISLEVAESERRRISADLHDDLGSGIAGLAIATALLAKTESIDELRSDAIKISESSQKVSRRLSEVIWELNMEHDNLEDLLLFIQKQGKNHFAGTGINFSMILPLEIPAIKVPGYARRQVYLAVKECFHNIIKHSGADMARCEAEFSDKLTLKISDNGKGFDTSGKFAGEGLKNLQYRLDKLNGSVNIASSPDGTTITLSVSLDAKA
jgi:signal transduction histidine kinase